MANYQDEPDMSMGFNFTDDYEAPNFLHAGDEDMADAESNVDFDEVCLFLSSESIKVVKPHTIL
jgi:hypothetical protein